MLTGGDWRSLPSDAWASLYSRFENFKKISPAATRNEGAVARFEAFAAATDFSPACDSFQELLAELTGEGCVYTRIRKAVGAEPRWSTLFDKLDAQLQSRGEAVDAPVLVLGAGPCGLRAAVEAALNGLRVRVVEKRKQASRANVLTMWAETHSWLLLLGVRELYPGFGEEPNLFIGTRELQLVLLKFALLLGARVRLGAEVVGLLPPAEDGGLWCARLKPYTSTKAAGGAAEAATEFKADKTADYVAGVGKCNKIEHAEVDENFLSGGRVEGEELEPFSGLILAEGESSNTTRALGFAKTVDTFGVAIGLVINMRYDRGSEAEASLESFSENSGINRTFEVGGQDGAEKAGAVILELAGLGLHVECLEYLKAESHYIACCVQKKGLLEHGVLREDLADRHQLVAAENIDMDQLAKLSRTFCGLVGLPPSCAPHEHNPFQIFDFSSRARCNEPCRVLLRDSVAAPYSCDLEEARAVVCPVGDALLEPFWPQGLGINRGFHSSASAVYCARLFAQKQAAASVDEAFFAYRCLIFGAWLPGYHPHRTIPRQLKPAAEWGTDPRTRLHDDVLIQVAMDSREKAKSGRAGDRVPERFEQMAKEHVPHWENWQ